jgi:hypothetical protein
MSMRIFEYAVLKEPTPDEAKTGATTVLLVPITPVMALNEEQAMMLAGRAVPEAELPNMDRITVAVRPF